jgi:hypothetical protein
MDATQFHSPTRPLHTARFPHGALVAATLGSLGRLDLAEPAAKTGMHATGEGTHGQGNLTDPAASLDSAATTRNRMARWRARLTAPIRRLAVSLMLAGAM